MQISVSCRLSLASAIDEEAFVMGKSYSEATVVLVRIGLEARRGTRASEGVKT